MNYDGLLENIKNKYDRMIELVNPEKSLFINGVEDNGRYTNKLVPLENTWSASFFAGIIAYLYFHFRDEKYLAYLNKLKGCYKDYLYNHLDEISVDIGFLYSLYAVALYKLTGDLEAKEIALKAADELIKRYHCESGVIQSFCRLDEKQPNTVVNTTMCTQLLMWAHKETKHPFYERVFSDHLQAVTNCLVRDDYTIRNSVLFDYKTGKPLSEKNWSGYSCGSSWARGMAWAIYSFTTVILHTGNEYLYLPTLSGMSERFIKELPDDGIPVWDFKLPENAEHILDTSAAAIVASAFNRIGRNISQDARTGRFKDCEKWSDIIFDTLINKYMADEKSENILEGGQQGKTNRGCIWGDYFFVELLMSKIYGSNVPDFWC